MEAEVDYKIKSNGNEEMNSKVKDWMPPHVKSDFTDHMKQKHLVVLVVLLMRVVHYNTNKYGHCSWKHTG